MGCCAKKEPYSFVTAFLYYLPRPLFHLSCQALRLVLCCYRMSSFFSYFSYNSDHSQHCHEVHCRFPPLLGERTPHTHSLTFFLISDLTFGRVKIFTAFAISDLNIFKHKTVRKNHRANTLYIFNGTFKYSCQSGLKPVITELHCCILAIILLNESIIAEFSTFRLSAVIG